MFCQVKLNNILVSCYQQRGIINDSILCGFFGFDVMADKKYLSYHRLCNI